MNSISHRISRTPEWSSVMDTTHVVPMKNIYIQVSNLASLFSCYEFAVDSRQPELKEIFCTESIRLVAL